MKQYLSIDNPLKVLGWTLAFLLVLFLCLEAWRYAAKPAPQEQATLITEKLNTAAAVFQNRQKDFLGDSQNLARTLQNQLISGASKATLFTTINSYNDFWGIRLLKDEEAYVWDGFEIAPPAKDRTQKATGRTITTKIAKQNNVLYWRSDVHFTIQQDTNLVVPYHLSTSARIEQRNVLPIGKSSEFSLTGSDFRKGSPIILYSFFNPLSQQTKNYRTLYSVEEDSIGVAYINTDGFSSSLSDWKSNNRFWRSIFIAFLFICISLVVSTWAEKTSKWTGLLFQLCLVAIGWLVFYWLDIPARWIPELLSASGDAGITGSYISLGNFLKANIFIFLVAVCLYRNLNFEVEPTKDNSFLSTISLGFFTGAGNLWAILAVIYGSFKLIKHSELAVLNQGIFPLPQTVFLYLALGLALFSLALALSSVNRFIILARLNQKKIISALVIIGFILALLIAQLFVPDSIRLNWAVVLTILAFGIIYGLSFLYVQRPTLISQLSTLRILVISSTLLALIITPIIYQAYLDRQDQNLQSLSASFAQNKDPVARALTTNMLTKLEQSFKGISKNDLENRSSFLQAEFTGIIESLIPTVKQSYSLDLQLIKPQGALIADYSTDLNSPNWVNVFDLQRLSAAVQMEQISKATNRPIVQRPELKNKDDYETFYRGWIPVFGEAEEDPIAWILCSVYKERPNFNKPIRAVLASLTYDDWNRSYLMLEYRDDRLYSSSQKGITGYYPKYNKLLNTEKLVLATDSLIFYTSQYGQNSYRNFLTKKAANRVIKVSTIAPDLRSILFSFFKLNFVLLIAGCTSLLVLHLMGIKKFIFLDQYQRFQNRILDNFLLATLLFLIILVFTTHYAIKQQNRDIVEQELFEKLKSLTRAAEAKPLFKKSRQQQHPLRLDSLASSLDVDASFYDDRTVTRSTTPQIFQQHLIASSLPFPVYDQLYNIQQRDAIRYVSLASQDLFIGYRSVLSPENEPVAVIAIPTFAQSPKYNQQLLETISYLIVLYLIVFGLFIFGTAFVARQLTKPLKRIQRGLDKISEGNLDTTIPVTSNDEIGGLAKAYNTMVYQLKELQTELAKAEREAAWKEMAQQVAHEIKNPLTPMKLNIQHLQRQLKTDAVSVEELKPKIQQITKNLIEQIQSLDTIASDFSKFSQPLDEEFREVELNAVLRSVTDLYGNDEDVLIHTQMAEREIIVQGISDELRRVFINLVKNAFEALPGRGTIRLKSYIKKDSAFIEVEDNGAGISEEDKSKIFVPNFSTKSSGTGLGLAICKKIIEAHEGTISFASIDGKGTTFIVKMPLAK